MVVQIPKIKINPFEAFGNDVLEAESEAEFAARDAAWMFVYNAVESGEATIAYWDTRRTPDSFTRYALHRSTRRAGCLQRSVMWMRGVEVVPLSHSEHDGARDFLERVAGSGAVTVILREA